MLEIIEVSFLDTKRRAIADVYNDTATAGSLSQDEAYKIVEAWVAADPGDESVGGPWLRTAMLLPGGIFVTALYGEGELSLSKWEPINPRADKMSYLTSTAPFEIEIHVLSRNI